jgi:hypothetical protein
MTGFTFQNEAGYGARPAAILLWRAGLPDDVNTVDLSLSGSRGEKGLPF